MHGNGHSRWFDKSMTIVVYANGIVGLYYYNPVLYITEYSTIHNNYYRQTISFLTTYIQVLTITNTCTAETWRKNSICVYVLLVQKPSTNICSCVLLAYLLCV